MPSMSMDMDMEMMPARKAGKASAGRKYKGAAARIAALDGKGVGGARLQRITRDMKKLHGLMAGA